jgi:hypothetical protein
MIEGYLGTYQMVGQKLRQWKEMLFEVRKKEEALLRGKKDYLQQLKKLDEALGKLVKTISEVESWWLTEINKTAVFHSEVIQEINHKYFRVLQSVEVKKLAWVEWVHHTCFDFRSTEGRVIPEMLARNAQINEGNFQTTDEFDYMRRVYTMTDFAVSQLSEASIAVKKVLVAIHPDRCRPPLLAVSEHCTKVLTDLRDKSSRMAKIWNQSQWGNANALSAQDTDDDQDETEVKIEVLERPSELLDMTIFESLHLAYLEWMQINVRPGLAKITRQQVPIDKMLYTGSEGDIQAQEAHQQMKVWGRQEERRCKKLNLALDETQKAGELALERLEKALINWVYKKMRESGFKKLSTGPAQEFYEGIAHLIQQVQEIFEEAKEEDIQQIIYTELTTNNEFQAFRSLIVSQPQPQANASFLSSRDFFFGQAAIVGAHAARACAP